jgi:hypothetical protein
MYTRPYIDTHNLEEDRLRTEEYEKALGYVRGLISQQKEVIREEVIEEGLEKLTDSDFLGLFKIGREVHSFLNTLPEGDIAAIMKQIFFTDLEKLVEEF